MRILLWQEGFSPQVGGIAAASEALLTVLLRRGHEILVVSRRDAADLPATSAWQGIPVRRFPFWQVLESRDPEAVAVLRREIVDVERTFAPDLVHMNGFGPSALFLWRSGRADASPVLLTLHSSNTLYEASDTLIQCALENARWVVGCSRSILEEGRRLVPEITSRSSVVYNGVEQPRIAAAPLPARPSLLCIGHLARDKGFDIAVRAMALLLRRFSDLRLVIAGDGPERGALQRQAVEAGVAAAVRFIGPIAHDRVPRLMNEATVILVPSRRESFSLVAVEAALMRRAVVASRVGGLPEVVEDGATGTLVPSESESAWAEAIAKVVADPAALTRLGEAARRRASALFDANRQGEAYEALYRRVVEGGSGRPSKTVV